jgi:hypothetical protein
MLTAQKTQSLWLKIQIQHCQSYKIAKIAIQTASMPVTWLTMLNAQQPPPREHCTDGCMRQKQTDLHISNEFLSTRLGLQWHDEQILGSVQQCNWINMYGSWTWSGLTCMGQPDDSPPKLDWPKNRIEWIDSARKFWVYWIGQNSPSIGSAMDWIG